MLKDCPCIVCTERHATCHSNCKREYTYKDWKADKEKEKERQDSLKSKEYDQYICSSRSKLFHRDMRKK